MDSPFEYKISNIEVVYEDEWLLVVDKPAGLLTLPAPKKELRTLSGILNEDAKKKGLSCRLYPCHRLDRETSGLIIYAKGKSMQRKMRKEFWRRNIKKTYIAFLHGKLSQDKGNIRYPIEGRGALTEYRIMEERNDFSIAEIMPLTGRTNQIRIHFKQVGHPLVGETKYAFRRDFKLKAKRLCLHAKMLEFIHPITKKAVSLTTPLPSDMEGFLRKHQ